MSDKVLEERKQSSPECFEHRQQTAAWKCNQCSLFISSQCRPNHDSHQVEQVENMLQNSRQKIVKSVQCLQLSTMVAVFSRLTTKQKE